MLATLFQERVVTMVSSSFIPDNFGFCGLCERHVRLRWEHLMPGLEVSRARCQGCGSCVLSIRGEHDLVGAFLDDLGEDPEAIMNLKRWSPGKPHKTVGHPDSRAMGGPPAVLD